MGAKSVLSVQFARMLTPGLCRRRQEGMALMGRIRAGSVYPRCRCRHGPGGKRRGASCPQLGKEGHGSWYFSLDLPRPPGEGRRRVRRGGYPTRQAAKAGAGPAVRALQRGDHGGGLAGDLAAHPRGCGTAPAPPTPRTSGSTWHRAWAAWCWPSCTPGTWRRCSARCWAGRGDERGAGAAGARDAALGAERRSARAVADRQPRPVCAAAAAPGAWVSKMTRFTHS
jgi:hypothetical protein